VITERPGHPRGAEVEILNSASVFRTTDGRLLTMDSHIALDPILFDLLFHTDNIVLFNVEFS
jgi:hypothetical protein